MKGVYWRKQVRFGWLRLNFSKSGVGASLGPRGFRVGRTARGQNYVAGGRHGLYFRRYQAMKKRGS